MKRIIPIVIFLAMLMPLSADGDFGNLSFFGGYSTQYDTPYIGFGGSYQYLSTISGGLSIGGGVHSDIGFGLKGSSLPVMVGALAGIATEIRIGSDVSINLTVGPGVVAEATDSRSYAGIGLGIDASLSYFFGETKSIGITAGTSLYPQFAVFSDEKDGGFSFMGTGYIAVSFRYPAPASLLAMPAVGYLIY